jgi:hypothetical protein
MVISSLWLVLFSPVFNSSYTQECKNHARPKNNNTVYDYQDNLCDCQDKKDASSITNLQGPGDSRRTRKRWRRDLDKFSAAVAASVHHRNVICPIAGDQNATCTISDPLMIDTLVWIESAIIRNFRAISSHRLGRHFPTSLVPAAADRESRCDEYLSFKGMHAFWG